MRRKDELEEHDDRPFVSSREENSFMDIPTSEMFSPISIPSKHSDASDSSEIEVDGITKESKKPLKNKPKSSRKSNSQEILPKETSPSSSLGLNIPKLGKHQRKLSKKDRSSRFEKKSDAFKSPYLARKLTQHLRRERKFTDVALDEHGEPIQSQHLSSQFMSPMSFNMNDPFYSENYNTDATLARSRRKPTLSSSTYSRQSFLSVDFGKYFYLVLKFFIPKDILDANHNQMLVSKLEGALFIAICTVLLGIFYMIFGIRNKLGWIWGVTQIFPILFSLGVIAHIKFERQINMNYLGNFLICAFVLQNALYNYNAGGKGRIALFSMCLAPGLSTLLANVTWVYVWTGVVILHSWSLWAMWEFGPLDIFFLDNEYSDISNIQLLVYVPLFFLFSAIIALLHESSVDSYIRGMERANSALRMARDEAMMAAQVKSEFLATMSHEIRTPLNGIIGFLQLALSINDLHSPNNSLSGLRKKSLTMSKEQEEYLQTAYSSAESLLSLLNDILDFSKMEAHQMKVDNIKFSLQGLLDDVLKVFAVNAHQKGLELVCDYDPNLPDEASGDPSRIRQIVANLVSNALKFTSQGEVIVRVEEYSKDSSLTQISVSDTGIGIASSRLHSIFEPYQQEKDGETTRNYGGTGLGLTVCAKLVELFGGKIWVESHAGVGSTFYFTVRLFEHVGHPIPDQIVALPIDAEEQKNLQVKRIFLISSQKSLLLSITRMLEWINLHCSRNYYEVAFCSLSRYVMWSEIERFHPHIVLVDSSLPSDDIDDLVQSLFSDFLFIEGVIRLCWATQLINMTEAQQYHRKNLSLLMKPFMAPSLNLAIEKLLSGTESLSETQPEKLDQLEELHGNKVTADSSTKDIDRISSITTANPLVPISSRLPGGMTIILVDDNLINLKVASRMLEKLGHKPSSFQFAKDAIESIEDQKFEVDCIFMDIQMEPMDGVETTKIIRAKEAELPENHRTIPIVAMTANAMAGDNEKYLKEGMNFYLSKPIRIPELIRCLDDVRRFRMFDAPSVFSSIQHSYYQQPTSGNSSRKDSQISILQ